MSGMIDTNVVCQIGLVVHDLEKTGQAFADFFGVERPPVVDSGEDEMVQGVVYGKRSDASCRMMFFETPTLQIELISPDDKPSVWRDILEEKGEGLHHIAFQVRDAKGKMEQLGRKGFPVLQYGNYGDGSGMYAYVDARDQLKLILELLESFPREN